MMGVCVREIDSCAHLAQLPASVCLAGLLIFMGWKIPLTLDGAQPKSFRLIQSQPDTLGLFGYFFLPFVICGCVASERAREAMSEEKSSDKFQSSVKPVPGGDLLCIL